MAPQIYLCKSIPMHFKKYMTKIRLSSHNLCVESGRINYTQRPECDCLFCKGEGIYNVVKTYTRSHFREN